MALIIKTTAEDFVKSAESYLVAYDKWQKGVVERLEVLNEKGVPLQHVDDTGKLVLAKGPSSLDTLVAKNGKTANKVLSALVVNEEMDDFLKRQTHTKRMANRKLGRLRGLARRYGWKAMGISFLVALPVGVYVWIKLSHRNTQEQQNLVTVDKAIVAMSKQKLQILQALFVRPLFNSFVTGWSWLQGKRDGFWAYECPFKLSSLEEINPGLIGFGSIVAEQIDKHSGAILVDGVPSEAFLESVFRQVFEWEKREEERKNILNLRNLSPESEKAIISDLADFAARYWDDANVEESKFLEIYYSLPLLKSTVAIWEQMRAGNPKYKGYVDPLSLPESLEEESSSLMLMRRFIVQALAEMKAEHISEDEAREVPQVLLKNGQLNLEHYEEFHRRVFRKIFFYAIHEGVIKDSGGDKQRDAFLKEAAEAALLFYVLVKDEKKDAEKALSPKAGAPKAGAPNAGAPSAGAENRKDRAQFRFSPGADKKSNVPRGPKGKDK